MRTFILPLSKLFSLSLNFVGFSDGGLRNTLARFGVGRCNGTFVGRDPRLRFLFGFLPLWFDNGWLGLNLSGSFWLWIPVFDFPGGGGGDRMALASNSSPPYLLSIAKSLDWSFSGSWRKSLWYFWGVLTTCWKNEFCLKFGGLKPFRNLRSLWSNLRILKRGFCLLLGVDKILGLKLDFWGLRFLLGNKRFIVIVPCWLQNSSLREAFSWK